MSTRKLQIAAGLRFRRVTGKGLVLDQREGRVMVLTEVGARVYELLAEGLLLEDGVPEDGQRDGILEGLLAEIVDQICTEFEVAPERARADVDAFVAELEEAGVLEPLE